MIVKNWGSIIKNLREKAGMTQEEFANKSKLQRGHISRIELNNYATVRQDTFSKLAKGLGMSLQELSTVLNGGAIPPVKELGRPPVTKTDSDAPIAIPVYPEFRFHAPGGIEAPIDYVYLQRTKTAGKNISAFTVEGDCMEPLIHSGDYIVVDSDADINSGDTVACKINEDLHIGKLRKFEGELWLENRVKRFKMVDCQIIAKVIQITRKL
jgi:transcriptional regulator with XRE-family HTH domain